MRDDMYEYKAVPAPVRAPRVKGLKTSADRFAHMLSAAINAEAYGGWQFLRSETLTCEERSALGRVKTTTQTVLIFAREVMSAQALDQADYDYAQAASQAAYAVEHAQDEAAYDAVPADNSYEHVAEADHQPAYDPEPYQPEPAPYRPAQRQEPLFRSGAVLRGDPKRPEPVLRPQPQDTDPERD